MGKPGDNAVKAAGKGRQGKQGLGGMTDPIQQKAQEYAV